MVLGKPLHVYQEIGSTNDEAMKLAISGAVEGTMVIAETQTHGRGRQGGKWFSPPGAGLWFSVVLRPACAPSQAPLLTQVAAQAIREAVERVTGIGLEIKYPNDLLWQGKKVCGILTESSVKGERVEFVIVGIGINTNMDEGDFPDTLRSSAASLRMALGRDVAGSQLLEAVLGSFEAAYESWRSMVH